MVDTNPNMKRITTEHRKLSKNPIENVRIELKNKEKTIWRCFITAAKESPYAGGVFELEADLRNGYPYQKP
jgi:ubiquitin-protein ligase